MGNFFKYAATVAATSFIASSFVSCDKEIGAEVEPDGFAPKHLHFTLPVTLGTGYCWQWTNKSRAAADSVMRRIEPANSESLSTGGAGYEAWEFLTKETGEEVLKFRYLREWDESSVVKDTVISFKK